MEPNQLYPKDTNKRHHLNEPYPKGTNESLAFQAPGDSSGLAFKRFLYDFIAAFSETVLVA
jgi:hypothetical protein